jgi:hypothetical protein
MKKTIKKSAPSTKKSLVKNTIKVESKLGVNAKGDLVDDSVSKINNDLIIDKLMDLKKAFGFKCLIKDVRAINLFDDCGFNDKTLYIKLVDNQKSEVSNVNGIYFYKQINYCLRIRFGKLSWIDLWKAIDEVVKLNGNQEDVIIKSFDVKVSASGKSYVNAVLEYKETPDIDLCFSF